MFKFEEDKKETYINISGDYHEAIKRIALNTPYEEEMFELTKTKNPFFMRELAKNKYISKKVALHLIKEHCAYTMLVNLAKNNIVDEEMKKELYLVANEGEYKDSMLKQDLDNIFKDRFFIKKLKLKSFI